MSTKQNAIELLTVARDSLFSYAPRNCLAWAKENVRLPRTHAFPGPYDPEKTPHLWRIAEALSDPRYEQVIIWMASQSGKTMIILLYFMLTLLFDPRAITMALPSKDLAKNMSRERFMELARGCPQIFSLIRDGEDSETFEKYVNGAPLRFVWTSSAVKCASYASGIVAMDEIDRMLALKYEGDPGELLETRTTTFSDPKIIKTSSPLIKDSSAIEAEFKTGTKEVYHKMCPNCRRYFEPTFKTTWWPSDCETEEDVRDQARVVCPSCEYKITNSELYRAKAVYIGEGQKQGDSDEIVGELSNTRIASFRINGLCSRFNSIGKLAARWWKADKDLDKRMVRLQGVINTGFGELWEIEGDVIDWEKLRETRVCVPTDDGKYITYKRGEVPDKVTNLVSAGDVHHLNIHYTIVGFDDNANAYVIDWGVVHGDTREGETWERADDCLSCEYDGFKIAKSFIDAGHRPDYVKDFCLRQWKRRLYIHCIGRNTLSKPLILEKGELDEHRLQVSHRKGAMKSAKIWDDYFKHALYSRLEYEGSDGRNQIYLPEDVDDVFLKQITGEKRVEDNGVITFKKTRENHYLDCMKMCLAIGLELLKVGKKKKRSK